VDLLTVSWHFCQRQFQVEILNDVFGEAPEATAEERSGATLYIHVPT
jgi:hypothetical protein